MSRAKKKPASGNIVGAQTGQPVTVVVYLGGVGPLVFRDYRLSGMTSGADIVPDPRGPDGPWDRYVVAGRWLDLSARREGLELPSETKRVRRKRR